jgi:hypothetical protein
MNYKFCKLLRDLDMAVYQDGKAMASTEFGKIIVRKANGAGYIAEIGDGEIPEHDRQSPTPAMAFVALRDHLGHLRDAKPKGTNVIDFNLSTKRKTCGLCEDPIYFETGENHRECERRSTNELARLDIV